MQHFKCEDSPKRPLSHEPKEKSMPPSNFLRTEDVLLSSSPCPITASLHLLLHLPKKTHVAAQNWSNNQRMLATTNLHTSEMFRKSLWLSTPVHKIWCKSSFATRAASKLQSTDMKICCLFLISGPFWTFLDQNWFCQFPEFVGRPLDGQNRTEQFKSQNFVFVVVNMSKFQGTKKYLMGLPPRPQYGAAPPQGGGVPKRFQKRALAAPSQEGMCLPLVSKLLDCYSGLGIDGMQEEGACVEERLEVIECQKKEVKHNPVRNSSFFFVINEHTFLFIFPISRNICCMHANPRSISSKRAFDSSATNQRTADTSFNQNIWTTI